MDDNIGASHQGPPAALSASAASHLLASFAAYEPISRSTSPGLPFPKSDDDDKRRYRQRTFAYFRQLPFEVEEEAQRDAALQGILKQLYIAIQAEDFSPGALHWTRELQGWLNLKFEMTRELRAKLAKLYYSLALAPGVDGNAADRFVRMAVNLTRYVGMGQASPLNPPLAVPLLIWTLGKIIISNRAKILLSTGNRCGQRSRPTCSPPKSQPISRTEDERPSSSSG